MKQERNASFLTKKGTEENAVAIPLGDVSVGSEASELLKKKKIWKRMRNFLDNKYVSSLEKSIRRRQEDCHA